MQPKLIDLETHFEFGENWKNFVATVSDRQVDEAVRSLQRLFPDGELRGRQFLDIGCGSGLSMLAALRLGAARVIGIDIDPSSVQAAKALLSRCAKASRWDVQAATVFEANPSSFGKFDVVHSWGVLHHTGDMWRAVRCAAGLVAPEGTLAIALYRRTPLDKFWVVEKRIYSRGPRLAQATIRALYKALFFAANALVGRNPVAYVRDYKRNRGMSWSHDVHDWLGGYPYETQGIGEVKEFLEAHGFVLMREFVKQGRMVGLGLFGSNVDEFVARRT